MDVTIRTATAEDAPFLAWVMQTAARSHVKLCFWDLAFPGPEAWRLDHIAAIALVEPSSFAHYSGFLIAEHDGRPVGGLSAYDPAEKGMGGFAGAIASVLAERQWSDDHMALLAERTAPSTTCMPDTEDGTWVIEWVAARPEARGRGVASALLREILDRGRAAGYKQSQIGYLIGNTPACTAYQRAGFAEVDEKRHADFEAAFGTPGIVRMLRDL